MSQGDEAARRLFIAVMLPPEIQQRLVELTHLLDAYHAVLRPVRAEALHVTLRFLGDTDAAHEREVIAACTDAVAGVVSFPITIGGFGVFPNEKRPRVVWLGLQHGAQELGDLHRRVQHELLRHKAIDRAEQFTPHLTLARVRDDARPADRTALGAAVAALPAIDQATVTVSSVSLVHSLLTPHGSRYTLLREFALEERR